MLKSYIANNRSYDICHYYTNQDSIALTTFTINTEE